jgi:hypothetical protein
MGPIAGSYRSSSTITPGLRPRSPDRLSFPGFVVGTPATLHCCVQACDEGGYGYGYGYGGGPVKLIAFVQTTTGATVTPFLEAALPNGISTNGTVGFITYAGHWDFEHAKLSRIDCDGCPPCRTGCLIFAETFGATDDCTFKTLAGSWDKTGPLTATADGSAALLMVPATDEQLADGIVLKLDFGSSATSGTAMAGLTFGSDDTGAPAYSVEAIATLDGSGHVTHWDLTFTDREGGTASASRDVLGDVFPSGTICVSVIGQLVAVKFAGMVLESYVLDPPIGRYAGVLGNNLAIINSFTYASARVGAGDCDPCNSFEVDSAPCKECTDTPGEIVAIIDSVAPGYEAFLGWTLHFRRDGSGDFGVCCYYSQPKPTNVDVTACAPAKIDFTCFDGASCDQCHGMGELPVIREFCSGGLDDFTFPCFQVPPFPPNPHPPGPPALPPLPPYAIPLGPPAWDTSFPAGRFSQRFAAACNACLTVNIIKGVDEAHSSFNFTFSFVIFYYTLTYLTELLGAGEGEAANPCRIDHITLACDGYASMQATGIVLGSSTCQPLEGGGYSFGSPVLHMSVAG